jgi:adenylate cyclase
MAVDAPDFAAAGLLDGLEGEARAQRLELLEWLHEQGFALDVLREAARDGLLGFLPAERAIADRPHLTVAEVAQRSGLEPERLLAMRRAQGLPVPPEGEVAYTELDVRAAETVRALRDAGVADEDAMDVTRTLGRSMGQTAEAMRALALRLVAQPGATERELAERYAQVAGRLVPLVQPVLGQVLSLHLRNIMRTELLDATEREAGVPPGAREVTVCFADLVGFTRLGEELEPGELGGLADRLATMTADLVARPVQLVKTIGDAVMLVSPEPEPLLALALALVDAADAEDERFPQLRAGLASGHAIRRSGDWFGRPVNLASRVAGAARAGSVLATKELRDTAREDFAWSYAGARRLKNVAGETPLYRVRRGDGENRSDG